MENLYTVTNEEGSAVFCGLREEQARRLVKECGFHVLQEEAQPEARTEDAPVEKKKPGRKPKTENQ